VKVHTFAQLGEQIMSAWGEYSFYSEPVFLYEWRDKIHIISKDSKSYTISTYINRDAPSTPITFEPALDRREQPSGSPSVIYHESKNWTEFRHNDRDASLANTRLVTNHDTNGQGGGRFLVPRYVGVHPDLGGTASSAFFWGRLDQNGDHWLGFVYDSYLILSDFWIRDSARRPVLQTIHILHQDTTDYELEISVDNQNDVFIEKWQAAITGATKIGQPAIHTGFSKHMILDDPRNLRLKIQSFSPGPMIIASLEYDLTVKAKS